MTLNELGQAALAKLPARIRNSAGMRGIGQMTMASAIGQVAIMSTMPIVTRLYDPAEFGVYSLVASFAGIATVAACLCLDLAIVQGSNEQEADELFAAALRSVVATTALSCVILGLLIHYAVFGFGHLPLSSAPIAAAMVGLNGIYLASRYRQLREHNFGLIASAGIFQNLGRATAPIIWWPVSHAWLGLALGELTGRSLGIRRLLSPLASKARSHAAFREGRHWVGVVRREWRYTGVLVASVLIDASSSLVVTPMLAQGYGPRVAGEYYLITTFLNAPLALIGAAFADVIHARSAALAINDPRALPAFVRRSAAALLGLGLVVYVPVYFLAPLVLPLFFGHQWTYIVPIARALTPFMIVAIVASPCSRVLIAVRQTNIKIIADAMRLVMAPAAIWLAARSQLGFTVAIQWLGGVLTVAYVLYFCAQYVAAVRVGRGHRPATITLSTPEAAAAPAGGAVDEPSVASKG
jgi:O-antigen/teichoic acid export membrane protein